MNAPASVSVLVRCPNCFLPLPQPGGQSPRPLASWARRAEREQSDEESRPVALDKCPRCSYQFLSGWQHTTSTCIAMAGARTTGKSIFIAVMIKQLQAYGAEVGMDVEPATAAVRQTFAENYEGPLYAERGIMVPTPPVGTNDAYQRDPLIFVITLKDGRRHHLIIRDVAGEDLENAHELAPGDLAFFSDADCVLFLFDPFKVDDIRNKLRDLIPEQTLGGDAKPVLDATLHLIRGADVRLGVVMSKFDIVQALKNVRGGGEWTAIMQNAGAAMFRDPGPTAGPDDGELLHWEVRSLLQKLDAGSLVYAAERAVGNRAGMCRYFAVSALGDPPNGQNLHPRGIAPFRCLDPLRWALQGTGVI